MWVYLDWQVCEFASLRVNLGVELAYYSRDSVSVALKGTGECRCRHNCVPLCLSHWKPCGLSHGELCCLSHNLNNTFSVDPIGVVNFSPLTHMCHLVVMKMTECTNLWTITINRINCQTQLSWC